MNQNFYFSLLIPIILSIFISIFFVPYLTNSSIVLRIPNNLAQNPSNSKTFLWPIPGYSKITSPFGYRIAPTTGAGTYHGGIDIAAPQNADILRIEDSLISYIGWDGANGYTVKVTHTNGYKSTYGHISPNFNVSIGDFVYKGQKIATVGPKYVEPTNYTTYIDKNTGKYTNGATTRSSFTFIYFSKWQKNRS